MSSIVRTDRGFEATNRSRSNPGLLKALSEEPRSYYYERLMQVSIRHTYYNSSGEASPDFSLHLTPFSNYLLRSLGLLFRQEEAGFSILYDTRRKTSLVQYLIRNSQDISGKKQFWTRLSFVLSLRNPYFLNFTQVPIITNPTTENFYFTNQEAHVDEIDGRSSGVILNSGDHVNAAELLAMAPVTFPIKVAEGAQEVWIRAISTRVVSCQPVCLFESLIKEKNLNPPTITCQEAREGSGKKVCTDRIYIDFSLLPEDRYTIEQVDQDGNPVEVLGPLLYSATFPQPLCFIDLMFSRPDPDQPGIYPVSDLFGVDVKDAPSVEIKPVHYELWFKRRRTFWSYYIIPRPQSVTLNNLRIEGDGADFAGPCRVRLANDQMAYRFVSKRRLELEEQPRQHFELKGRNAETHEKISIERLPVATIQQVLPMSEIDVCRSLLYSLCCEDPDERCLELMAQLCCSAESGIEECLEDLQRFRENPADPEIRQRLENREESSQLRSYSDIFVYV